MLNKKLETGTIVKVWPYEEGNVVGITVGSKKKASDEPVPLLHIESARFARGAVNRIVIETDTVKQQGWLVLEDQKGKTELSFKSINCDEQERIWNFERLEDLASVYYSDTADIPSNDDAITECAFRGTPMCFNTFGELIRVFSIEK